MRIRDLILADKDLGDRLRKFLTQVPTHESGQIKQALGAVAECRHVLANKKIQAIQNQVITMERRKSKDNALDKLKLPVLASALDYKLWFKLVTIKNVGTMSLPSKQSVLQILKKSLQVKPVAAAVHRLLLVRSIMRTVTRELGLL